MWVGASDHDIPKKRVRLKLRSQGAQYITPSVLMLQLSDITEQYLSSVILHYLCVFQEAHQEYIKKV